MKIKDTAVDILRQAFMSREDYDELREEEKVWRKLQKPLCMVAFTVVWTAVVIAMMIMVYVVFEVSDQKYPFCQKRRLPSYNLAGDASDRGDLPSYVYTEEEAVDAFWMVAFLPTSVVYVFSIIYLFAGEHSWPLNLEHLNQKSGLSLLPAICVVEF